ncbi:MAG: phosphatase PAP2 family protein [Candidatus Pacebacteria bacterium]|jgi:undecaprenyl-diphosphatase|nr:phosphatase PAP2 family protein [Candidatus Paceibacterota bacterium]
MAIFEKIKTMVRVGRTSRAGFLILAEITAGIVLALTTLWLFIAIADNVIEKETTTFDNNIQAAVYSLRSPAMTTAMFTISSFGSKEFLFAISLVIIAVLSLKNKRRNALTYTVILLASAGLNNLIKFAVHRNRPQLSPIENASFFSFPSGHSMNSLVFYGLMAYFVWHYTKNKTLGATAYLFAIILVAAIGISRIYLGAHYPTDVLAGFVAGICVLSAAIAIDKTLELNRLLEKSKSSKPAS